VLFRYVSEIVSPVRLRFHGESLFLNIISHFMKSKWFPGMFQRVFHKWNGCVSEIFQHLPQKWFSSASAMFNVFHVTQSYFKNVSSSVSEIIEQCFRNEKVVFQRMFQRISCNSKNASASSDDSTMIIRWITSSIHWIAEVTFTWITGVIHSTYELHSLNYWAPFIELQVAFAELQM